LAAIWLFIGWFQGHLIWPLENVPTADRIDASAICYRCEATA
jgi:hypothetical protein